LLFNPSTDEFSHRPGGAHWKFVRQNGTLVVEVDDIHRTVWSFTISY
jgi:hypothetical protein